MLEKSLSHLKTNWVPLISSCLKKYPLIDSKLSEEQENFEGLAEIYPPIDLIFNCVYGLFNLQPSNRFIIDFLSILL